MFPLINYPAAKELVSQRRLLVSVHAGLHGRGMTLQDPVHRQVDDILRGVHSGLRPSESLLWPKSSFPLHLYSASSFCLLACLVYSRTPARGEGNLLFLSTVIEARENECAFAVVFSIYSPNW